uniref:Anosmin 1 n=1 Tax=Sinocyclocheilus grahami TaxID=75366 RepID=A0A672QZQ0_SINGR
MLALTLWTLALLWSAARVDARGPDEFFSGSVYRARCASRCLSLHITRISAAFKHFQSNGSLVWCQNHKQCSKCLEPCRASWDLKENQCQDLCETQFPRKHYECLTSCEFLRSAQTLKPGDCPAAERASGFAAACVESCEADAECTALKRCCPNGCGHTCQIPKNPYKGTNTSSAKTMNHLLPLMSFKPVATHILTGPGSLLTVRISWTLPAEPDIPVHLYKIYWSWTVPGKSAMLSRRRRRKTSDGARSSVDLEGLQANSSYSVEVQAVSYWGQIRLKSARASVQFNTQLHNQTSAVSKAPELGLVSMKRAAGALEVGTPYYQDRQLQVHIYWKKRGGTSIQQHNKNFILHHNNISQYLVFSCIFDQINALCVFCNVFQDRNRLVVSSLRPATFYRLEVQVITAAGEGPVTKKIFQTPDWPPLQQTHLHHQQKQHHKSSAEKH